MNSAATPQTTPARTADDNISHIVCCDENTALCGLDVTDYPWIDLPEQYDCPLCVLAAETDTCCPCPTCPGEE
jgi:hypothetical protein